MIKVSKKASDCPREFKKKAAQETKKNRQAIRLKKYDEIRFKAYKDAILADVLKEIFNNKCAYCESNISYGARYDIEHFRPKSKTFSKGQPKTGYIGYYWLAADWDNLLYSCQLCNRPNQHHVPGQVNKITIGKHEQFPLLDESARCKRPNASKFLAEEKVRLLINPCKENGELFFVFEDSGTNTGNIKVNPKLNGMQLKKAEKSIEVYALHRIELVKKRGELISELNKKIVSIDREIRWYNSTTGRTKEEHLSCLKEYINDLLEFAMPAKEFSALAKQVVGRYLKNISPLIKRLTGV